MTSFATDLATPSVTDVRNAYLVQHHFTRKFKKKSAKQDSRTSLLYYGIPQCYGRTLHTDTLPRLMYKDVHWRDLRW